MAYQGRTFRIFVSSTFSDLKAERNALQEYVFPRLRELCQQQGARFQAIDLRWGVSEEASSDQQTMKICLEEIARCQRITPRPNFVVLLGDRYGWCPLPLEIPKDEFERILENVSVRDRDLLCWREDQPIDQKGWYRLDDNALYQRRDRMLPGVYILQARTGKYKDYAVWQQDVELPLRRILMGAIKDLKLTEEARLKYEASATHQEIEQGAIQIEDAQEHVFCFFREIKGLPKDQRSAGFLDLEDTRDGRVKPDSEARARLDRLKDRLKRRLPTHTYRAKWTGRDITTNHLGTLPEKIDDCLKLLTDTRAPSSLCLDVWRRLATVILHEVATIKAADPLNQEIANHQAFGEERARNFLGRTPLLETIRAYIEGSDPHPLVVWGDSGSGKSALLAKAHLQTQAESLDAQFVYRFIGATPDSTNIRSLLESLCKQIAGAYGIDISSVPSDYEELKKDFFHWLANATVAKPLILFIDALDQLSAAYQARGLFWLPSDLPQHVRLVVSTLPGECLTALGAKLPPENLIKIEPMSLEEGNALLDLWLAEAGRTLEKGQRAEVLSKFSQCRMPLFLKLAFEEARKWRSYDGLPEVVSGVRGLSEDIPGMILNLFVRLAQPVNHGKLLVERSLSYLAVSRSGLSEDELLDLLSQDNEVFQEFIRRAVHEPPEKRLPIVVWSRLFFDLEPYLTTRRADDALLLAFYHQTSFREAVVTKYLDAFNRQDRHRTLAGYFANQPVFSKYNGERIPNQRKLSELPYQQAHGELWDELRATLSDFNFLHTKIVATPPQQLIDDYEEGVRAGYAGEDLSPIQDAIRLSAHVISADPAQFAGQLIGRLSPSGAPPTRRLLGQAREWDGADWLCPLFPSLMPTGGPLLRTLIGHTDWVGAVAVTPDGRWAISGADDWTLKLWDLEQGEELMTFSGHTSSVRGVAVTPDGKRAVSASADETLKIWDLQRGVELRSLIGHDGEVNAVAVTPDGRRAVSASADGTLRVWDLDRGESLSTLVGHTDWVRAVVVTPDGRRAISGSDDGTVRVWNLEDGAILDTFPVSMHRVNGVAVTPDGRRVISASSDRQLMVWDLDEGRGSVGHLRSRGGWVRAVVVTPDGTKAISCSDDWTLKVWDLEQYEELRTLSGHSDSVWGLAITPDGRRVVSVSGDQTLKVWDLEREEESRPLFGHPDYGVRGVAFTSDGRLISASSDETLKVWDLERGQELYTLTGHAKGIWGVAVTPDGRRAVSASVDKTLKVWDLVRREEICTLTAHNDWVNAVAITPDGHCAVSASHDESLSVWDLDQGREIRPLVGHKGDVTAVAVTKDGRRAVSASMDKTIKVWDLERGRELQSLSGHLKGLRGVAVTPDGRLAISCSDDGTLKVWNLEQGKELYTLIGHNGVVWAVAITPDERRVVSASQDKTVKVWDLQRRQVVATFTGESPIHSCAVAQDGNTIAIGEDRHRIHVLQLRAAID